MKATLKGVLALVTLTEQANGISRTKAAREKTARALAQSRLA